jgi:hypothetical protein
MRAAMKARVPRTALWMGLEKTCLALFLCLLTNLLTQPPTFAEWPRQAFKNTPPTAPGLGFLRALAHGSESRAHQPRPLPTAIQARKCSKQSPLTATLPPTLSDLVFLRSDSPTTYRPADEQQNDPSRSTCQCFIPGLKLSGSWHLKPRDSCPNERGRERERERERERTKLRDRQRYRMLPMLPTQVPC